MGMGIPKDSPNAKMKIFILILSFCQIFCLPTKTDTRDKNSNKVLLILIDGFRWDYLNFPDLVGFPRISKEGVRAEYMEALYPSESYPGYYSVATGLYGESHGMVLNYMYDNNTNQVSQLAKNNIVDQPFWWEDAEPIWITTTKRNISTAMMLWPGSSTLINGTRANIFEPYATVPGVDTFRRHLNNVLEMFSTDKIRYAQVYCELTDMIGHEHGPDSPLIKNAVKELDAVMNEFLDNVTKMNLNDSLHFVIVSDHGMTGTDTNSVITTNLNDVLHADEVIRVLDRGSHVGIYPAEGHDPKEIVFKLKTLKGIDVYEKEDIPDRYHFKHHRRVPPIFGVVHKGYFLLGLNDAKQHPRDDLTKKWGGFHGYDPAEPDMRAIFLAWGKELKQGFSAPSIHITDPYNLLAHLIGISPLENNGTWTRMEAMLKTRADEESQSVNTGSSASTISVSIALIFITAIFLRPIF